MFWEGKSISDYVGRFCRRNNPSFLLALIRPNLGPDKAQIKDKGTKGFPIISPRF